MSWHDCIAVVGKFAFRAFRQKGLLAITSFIGFRHQSYMEEFRKMALVRVKVDHLAKLTTCQTAPLPTCPIWLINAV